MTEPKDAIWDTSFDYERQEPPKTEFDRDFDRWMQDPEFAQGYAQERAKIDAGTCAVIDEGERIVPAKVYCPLCLHPVVRHEPNDGSCGDCACKGAAYFRWPLGDE
jgi:hypothetical protein